MGGSVKFKENPKAQTLKDLLVHATLTEAKPLDGHARDKRYEMIKKLKDATDETDWTLDELKSLKTWVGEVPTFGVLVHGAIVDLLEGRNE
jgi:hypothetical protein